MNPDAAVIADVMGGPGILGWQVATMRDLDDAVREGIPKRALDRVIPLIAPPGNGSTTGVRRATRSSRGRPTKRRIGSTYR